ncbi:MAG: iron ABC transporter permease [Bacteroidota bacterium]
MFNLKSLKRDTNRWSWYTLFLVGFVTLPLFALFIRTFSGPGESWSHLMDTVLVGYAINSLLLVLGTSFFSLLLGISSAWAVSRYRFPFKKTLEWLLIVPLTLPSYIMAYAYAGIFDYGGAFSVFAKALGLGYDKVDILNLPGLIFILSISLYPYVYVASRAVFLYQSSRLIEASSLLGAKESKTLFQVVLPMARPAIFGGLLLVVMEVLNDYGAAKYYGVSTLTTGIFRAWFALEEPNTAVFLSIILLLMVFTFVVLERWQRGNRSFQIATKSDIRLQPIHPSKRKGVFLFVIASTPVFLGFLLPLFQLLKWLGITWYKTSSSDYIRIALQSMGIALLSAVLTVLVVLMVIYFPKWNRLKILKGSTSLATLGYAIPGAILAIGVMLPTLQIDRWLLKLSQSVNGSDFGTIFLLNGTIIALVYAYIIRFLAVGFKPLKGSQLKLGESLSESSKLLGKSTLKTFFKIDAPLLKTGILSALLLVFVDIMKELPLTLILKPYDVNTLAVKAYEYASDELIMESALPSLTIIIAGLLPILFLNKLLLQDSRSTKEKNRRTIH